MSVLGVYLPILWFVVVGILSVQVLLTLYEHRFDVSAFLSSEINVIELQKPVAFDLGWKSMAILAMIIWYFNQRSKPVYLIDFAVFEPPESWKLSHEQLMDIMGKQGCFTEDSLNFLSRLYSSLLSSFILHYLLVFHVFISFLLLNASYYLSLS